MLRPPCKRIHSMSATAPASTCPRSASARAMPEDALHTSCRGRLPSPVASGCENNAASGLGTDRTIQQEQRGCIATEAGTGRQGGGLDSSGMQGARVTVGLRVPADALLALGAGGGEVMPALATASSSGLATCARGWVVCIAAGRSGRLAATVLTPSVPRLEEACSAATPGLARPSSGCAAAVGLQCIALHCSALACLRHQHCVVTLKGCVHVHVCRGQGSGEGVRGPWACAQRSVRGSCRTAAPGQGGRQGTMNSGRTVEHGPDAVQRHETHACTQRREGTGPERA